MIQFFSDLQSYAFLRYALLAGILAAIPSGIVGSIIVVRRSTYIAGAISHCILGGMGIARFLQTVYGVQWLTPLTGATIAAILAALIISWATIEGKERMDSVLSILWAIGMALGITFMMKTPGYGQDLMSYLFGSILMVSPGDLLLMSLLTTIVLTLIALFYNSILAICFNEEAALIHGVPVGLYTTIIHILTALTTVLLVRVVGIVLVIALLTIPAATAARFTGRLFSMMIAATAISFGVTIGGLLIAYQPELPVGATIIELAGILYLVVAGIGFLKRNGP